MAGPSQQLRDEGFFEFKKKAGKGLCWVKGCRKTAKHDRPVCAMHHMRRWRAQQKKTADYCTLRDHAVARGIEFNLTPEYWRGVVDAFAYYEADVDEVVSIDRVDPMKGYVEGNIRVVSFSLNAYKAVREKFLPEHVQHMLDRQRKQKQKENEKFLAMKPEPEEAPLLPPEEEEKSDLFQQWDAEIKSEGAPDEPF